MRKCFSFVGTGELKPARYTLGKNRSDTCVIQQALAEFYQPELTVLFVTGKARTGNLPKVITSLKEHPYTVIDIPDGQTDTELWEIFNKISGQVSPEDEILLDITHAYRFMPFLAFLTALYIREVAGAGLCGVVYGAYEAGEDICDSDGQTRRISPISDLTSFLTLADWMMAVRSFVSFADAGGIKAMVSENRVPGASHSMTGENTPYDTLSNLASSLHQFTSAVQLARPIEAGSSGVEVLKNLAQFRNEIESDFPALSPVLEKITKVPPLTQATSPSPSWNTLKSQLLVISYQVEKGLYLQAAELAREWMVSAVICHQGLFSSWLKETVRRDAEDALHALTLKKKRKPYRSSPMVKRLERINDWEKIADTWQKIARIRNDLAHCGMRENRADTKTLESNILAIPEDLEAFYQKLRSV